MQQVPSVRHVIYVLLAIPVPAALFLLIYGAFVLLSRPKTEPPCTPTDTIVVRLSDFTFALNAASRPALNYEFFQDKDTQYTLVGDWRNPTTCKPRNGKIPRVSSISSGSKIALMPVAVPAPDMGDIWYYRIASPLPGKGPAKFRDTGKEGYVTNADGTISQFVPNVCKDGGCDFCSAGTYVIEKNLIISNDLGCSLISKETWPSTHQKIMNYFELLKIPN